MEYIKIEKLKPHPKNDYYFDNITGDPWGDFLDSIRWSNGPIDPIVITPDYVIVSGHQRVRACKELGIEEVKCITKHFDNEDEILRALIETNIRQRGIGNPNPVKYGRCILELERIYGIKNGGDRTLDKSNSTSTNGGTEKTQADLMRELGINKEAYRRYKKLTTLPEEIQQAVIDGVVNQSVASRVIARLLPDEQKEIAEKIIGEDSVSTKQIEEYIAQIKAAKLESDKLRKALSESETRRIKAEQEQKIPDDYEEAKQQAELAKAYEADYKRERDRVTEEKQKNLQLRDEIEALKTQTAHATTSTKLIEGSIYFVAQCDSFVRDISGYVWIAEKIAELPEEERINFMKAVSAIHDWSEALQRNIEKNI